MRLMITAGVAALAIGTASMAVPAFAQQSASVHHRTAAHGRALYASTGAAAAAQTGGAARPGNPTYPNVGHTGAPLSPGGISTGGSSFGGPGFNGPY